MSDTNKSQKILLNSDNLNQDKHIFIKLEKDIKQLEVLSLKIDQKDIYQSFNADYGVLIGRVISNNGIGVPNAKLSIFIPLNDEDSNNPDIVSIYPFKTPRDKDINGKRYNLLPRVSEYSQSTGTYKPKQPFGTFPTKPEIVTNENLLGVYKSYYKFTSVTNDYGDFMIYGAPVGTQTVHLSVDITDIGKYSMTPASMVTNLGYSSNLFTNNNTKIKESNDLNDLPHIETQDIAIEIVPFWGDTENFDIGITRQDFKIKAKIELSFTVFGSSMTYGKTALIGDPGRSYAGQPCPDEGFYRVTNTQSNNYDIRVFRPAPPIIRVFSYSQNTPIEDITNNSADIDFEKQIFELDKSSYFEYVDENGVFVLNIPCNRTRKIIDSFGSEIIVDDNNPSGSFTEFYGMIIVEYPDSLTIDKTYSEEFSFANKAETNRGRLKFPSSSGLLREDPLNEEHNNAWRKEYFKFQSGRLYSIAQFLPTKYIHNLPSGFELITNSVNRLDLSENSTGGIFFKVGGLNQVTQTDIDELNYIVAPSGSTTNFTYDFPANGIALDSGDKLFGGQFINLVCILPQFTTSGGNTDPFRHQIVADFIYEGYNNDGTNYFISDNDQLIFGTLRNSKNLISGFANKTDFIEIPSSEIAKLDKINKKGINVALDNIFIPDPEQRINPNNFKYRIPFSEVDGRGYASGAFDINYPYLSNTNSAFLFKGMYLGDSIKKLFDLNII